MQTQSRSSKNTVLNRLKTLLGPESAPTSLGLLFVLSLVHELSHASTDETAFPRELADLQSLLDNQADLQKVVEIIQDAYPEIADQLFGEQAINPELLAADAVDSGVDIAAVSAELEVLEASGYLSREEALRLSNALKTLADGGVAEGGFQDVIVAQAAADPAGTTGTAAADAAGAAEPAAAEGAAAGAGAEEVAIEALPATGAGPLAFALGPLLAGGAAVAVVASTTSTTSATTAPATDTTAPTAPTFALTVDTGKSTTDGITSDGRVTVSGLESGASWQYSTNSGTSWTTGSGSSFTLGASTYAAGAVKVRQTDAAGNTSAVTSSGSALTVDASAPANTPTVASSRVASTVTLTFDSTLDDSGARAPQTSAFVVQTRPDGASPWVDVTVNSVTVSGSTVTLNTGALTTGHQLRVAYTDGAGDNDRAIQDLSGNDVASFSGITGNVVDGYVRGAQIYIDSNNNGLPEESEMLAGVKTDVNGNFFLPESASGTILAVGGFNIDTGIANTVILKAPAGSTVITPLTTLVQSYRDSNPTVSADSANAAVLAALNLPTTINLATYDPLAILQANPNSAEALAVQKMAAQVATVVQLATESPAAGVTSQVAGNSVIANLVNQVSTAATNGTQVSLTDTTTLNSVLGSTTTATSTTAFNATDAINSATTLSGVSDAQSTALDKTPPAAPTLALTTGSDSGTAGDGITNTASPVVRVSFNTSATDGTAVVVGNTLKLYNGGVLADTITLTSTQITNGYVDIALSGLSGTSALTATITDKGQTGFNVSNTSSTFSLTVDTSVATPTLTFTDTGSLTNDGITNNGTVTVSDIESGATWQYSTNNGTDWTSGSGNSFSLTGDGAKSVLVRQTDVAGNTATSSALNFTLDTAAPATPTISTVAGNNAVDHAEATSGSGITVTGTAPVGSNLTVIWGAKTFTNVPVDGLGAWSVNFAAADVPSDNPTSAVVARATDAAGNVSTGTQAVVISTSRTDTTRPDTPVINNVAADNTVNAAEKTAGVVVSGIAEAGSTVAVNWGGTIQSVTATADGSWSTTFASSVIPANGSSTITATARDIANNESLVAASRSVTIDTSLPVAPTLEITDTGSLGNDGITNNRAVTVGNLEGGASWQYSLDSGSTWTTGSGSSFTLAANTTYASGAIQVRQTDAAGNTSATATRAVTVDTTASNAPVINAVATDNIVNSTEKTAGVAVSGTAEAGSSVAVTWGSNSQTAITAADGTWTTTFATSVIPADGSRPITAIATDVAGNASASTSRAVSVDTSGPAAPTINTVAGDNTITVAERSAGVTLSGTAEIGSTLTLNWGSLTKTVSVGATGNWSTTVASADLPATGSTITVSARDAAGNPGASHTTPNPITIHQIGSNATGVLLADITSPTYAGFDSLTLATNQTRSLTATEYLNSDFTAALAKITNAVSEYTLTVTDVQAADVATIGARANVDTITLASGQTITLTSADYSANAAALGKISNAAGDYTLNVTGATAANALSLIADTKVDSVTLTEGVGQTQTLSLTLAQYNANSATTATGLGKITNDPGTYTLNITGITSSNLVDALAAAGSDARVDNIALASGQTFSLTAAQYSASTAGLAKISNAAADYTLNVTGVESSNVQAIGANLRVDGITLAANQTLNLTQTQYLDNSAVLAKISNAADAYTLNVSDVTAANALTIGANAKVDSMTLDASQSFTLSLADYNAAQTSFGKISNPVADYSVTLSIATADEAADIATLVSQGNASGRIDVLDAQDNAITITDVQAEALAAAGVHFASDDVVTVTAGGSSLQSSLSNLQKLGVDAIMVTGAGAGFGIPVGSDPVNFSALPAITAPDAVRVGLVLPDSYVGTLEAPQTLHAAELKAAGFDAIFAADGSLTLDATQAGELKAAGLGYRLSDDITLSIRPGGETAAIASLVDSIDGGTFTASAIDHLNVYDNAIDITAAQATSLVNAGLDFATEDVVTVNAVGTQLHTSLSGLQNLGVDVLNISGVTGAYDIAIGTSTIDFAHLPTISADSGMQVNLQLAEDGTDGATMSDLVSNAAQLVAAGIDAISAVDGNLTLSAQQVLNLHTAGLILDPADAVTMRISTGQEADAISTLATNISTSHYPGDLDILDVIDNSITITDAQASLLVGAGLQFSSEDTVAVQATGTHLQTNLSGLQSLGVDVVNVAATTGAFAIDAGTDTIDFAHLPTISAADGVRVGLSVADSYVGTLTVPQTIHAADLKAAGFDAIFAADGSLTLDATQAGEIKDAGLGYRLSDDITMSIRPLGESTAISTLVGNIDAHTFTNGAIDHLDVYDNAIDITDAQAHSLVSAGLNFAVSDTGVAVHAAGTHLTTSLTDLQHLGVDLVHTDGSINTVVVELGSSGFMSNVLPVFDAEDHVKLVAGDTQLSSVEDILNSVGHNDPHIDELSVVLNTTLGSIQGLVGNGILDAALQSAFNHPGQGFEIEVANSSISEVTLGMVLNAADGSADSLHVLSGDSLVAALQAAGINDINVQSVTHFQVADSDLKPLMDAGLIKAEAGADVSVTNSDGSLDVSLAQLANIGVDHVQTTSSTATTLQVDAGVSFSDGAGLTAALNQLVATFEAQGTGGTGHTLFEADDTVDLHVAASLPTYELGADLVAKLELLGIDGIKDANGHSIKPTT